MSGIHHLLLGAGGGVQVPVDPYFYSVTSLLHGDGTNGGQNNTFLDSSSNNFTITRNGNTTQGSFSPFSQTGWSNYFDGSGDYLSLNGGTPLSFGTGDFTIEGWYYFASTSANLIDFRPGGGNGAYPALYITSGSLRYYVNSADRITSGSTLVANTWYHIAISRSGSSTRMFVNGTQEGSTYSDSTNYTVGTNRPVIGVSAFDVASNFFSGYMSNIRAVKGTAVYTANFTPSTTPLTAISGTSLLTCQANRFLDASSNNFTITRDGDVSVQPFSPFNPTTAYSTSAIGGSGYFDGSGDYLTTPTNTAFSFGTGDFTISTWIYTGDDSLSPLGYSRSVFTLGDIIGYLRINLYHGGTTGAFRAFVGGVHICDGSTVKLSDSAWHNITIVRESGNVRHWIDGIYVGTVAYSTSITNTITNGIGADMRGPDGNWNGYISGMYVNKGTALFTGTSNISVPTTPPTTSSGNSFLLNFTNGAIFDNAAVADYETVGNAQISTSVKKYGTGSMYFDGNGDYLFTPSNQTLAFGTADFTIEFWVYFNAVNTIQVVLDFRPNATASSASPDLYLNSDGTLRWFVSGADRITSGALSASTWYHVAICRVASQTKLFINGTQSGSTYADTTSYLQSGAAFGLNRNNGGSAFYYLNGYIDDLRISNGIGRYPYNFTPPEAEFPNIGGTVTLTADPYFDYTTLLLPGNGTNGAQNNTFLDSSTNAFSITRNGNTTQGTFSPFSQTGWSNYFDGTGDYLTTNATQAIPATGDFTVDGWIWCNSYALGPSIISQGTAGTSGRTVIYITAAGKLALQITSTINEFGSAIPTNQWVYFAITRTGSTVTGYINGSSVGTATNSGSIQNTTLEIGGEWNGDPYRWIGYLSNIRVSNIVRTITAAPTAPFTSDANTVVLTCQSNRFIDASSNAYTITRNGDVSVQAFSPFNPTAAWSAATNGGSGYFDGSGDYLTAPSNAAFGFGTGDFTVEAWVYINTATSYANIVAGPSGGATWYMEYSSTRGFYFYDGTNALNGSSSVVTSTWKHLAVSRSGTTLRMFVDGVLTATHTTSSNLPQIAPAIGAYNDGTYLVNGYISNLRLVKGTAVYTAAFTPPTAPLTAISGTSLLTNFTNAGIYDATSKNDLETVGNAQISTAVSKFGGSSMYFDGTGDYLAAADSRNFDLGGGDWTIEAWLYISTAKNYNGWYGKRQTSQFGLTLQVDSSGVLSISASTTGSSWALAGASLGGGYSTGAWTHVAVTRFGNTITGWKNGVSTGTQTLSGSLFPATGYFATIGSANDSSQEFNGYIQDFRLTKGIARYTSNFTPPTTAFLTL